MVNFFDMYYVYALLSAKNNDLYIGFSANLKRRFEDHESGLVEATKPNRPWKLVFYESYLDKRDATKREKQLKHHKAKIDLREQIKYSLVSGLAKPGLAT